MKYKSTPIFNLNSWDSLYQNLYGSSILQFVTHPHPLQTHRSHKEIEFILPMSALVLQTFQVQEALSSGIDSVLRSNINSFKSQHLTIKLLIDGSWQGQF